MNPLFDLSYHIPDGEAHVMPDGRLYVYGSWDKPPFAAFCSDEYTVFSTDDMVHWKNHGKSFDGHSIPWCKDGCLYAPDCTEKDGKYYLFFCMNDASEGFAVSDTPSGPFLHPTKIDTLGYAGIDPAVFRDDDGTVYYLWGQFALHGAILKDDMSGLCEASVTHNLLTEWEHGFHEGSSLRKRNGIYYLIFTDISRGSASCLSYATSDHPLGPYTKRGVIIDNIGCDPSDWNNHGSIECFNGQWYVFYHRTTHNCMSARRLCAEPIFFDENGLISEVRMTVNGSEPPLSCSEWIPASLASRMFGGMYITDDESGEYITDCQMKKWEYAWAEYRGLKFSASPAHCYITLRGKGSVFLLTEGSQLIGKADFSSKCFECIEIPVTVPDHASSLWIQFRGDPDSRIDFRRFRIL